MARVEMTVPAACLKGDSHGQSKKARRGAQEEFETRQTKRQACSQDGGKARDAEKSEVQNPARGHERDETSGQEKKGPAGDSGKKTTNEDASQNHDDRRHRAASPRRGCCYGVRIGSDGDLHFTRWRAPARRRHRSCWHVHIGSDQAERPEHDFRPLSRLASPPQRAAESPHGRLGAQTVPRARPRRMRWCGAR
jgi:hypothetical protein